jgi:ABC-type multidrug transport system fused ATPase/permease subunit
MPEKTKESSILYLFRFAKPYLGLIILSLVLLIAGRTFASFEPIWLKKVIDGLAVHSAFGVIVGFLLIYFSLNLGYFATHVRNAIHAPPRFAGSVSS